MLTKSDVADDIEATVDELRAVAAGVPVHIASGITRVGLEPIRAAAEGGRTLAFFGASGVGKSTLVNSLIGRQEMATSEVREHDQEPGCAVQAAISAGELDPLRFASLRRLVAEEAALEEEQARRERIADRRKGGREPLDDDPDGE